MALVVSRSGDVLPKTHSDKLRFLNVNLDLHVQVDYNPAFLN